MRLGSLIFPALAFVTLSAKASADTSNLFACDDRGFILQRCALVRTKLAEAIVEGARAYETDYAVTYDFPCFGNRPDVGVRAGSAVVPFRLGAMNEVLPMVSSTLDLETYDPDPDETRRLSFRPGCSLTVRSVNRLPSADTIRTWGEEARAEGRIIVLSRRILSVVEDYQRLSRYSTRVLDDVLEQLDALLVSDPANPDYLAMRDYVRDEREGKPSPLTPEMRDRAASAVLARLRADLATEVAKGQSLLDRFARWQLQAEATLKDALASVPAP